MSESPTPSLHELVSHTAWVRALAGRLVADPELAEDLAQATCVVALERGPAVGPGLRGWLATVMRNLLRQHHRHEGERNRREAQGAAAEALPSADAMVARVEVHRSVVEAVLSLEEPYRQVVLWRYFEERPPRVIASRLGVPVTTVYSQLQRAHQQLRGRLQRSFGGEQRAWLMAVLSLTGPDRVGHPLIATGALLMQGKMLVAALFAAVSFVAVGTWLVWPEAIEEASVGSATTVATPLPNHEPGIPAATAMASGADRSAEDSTARRASRVLPEINPDISVPGHECRGRVFDASGRPLAGVSVGSDAAENVLATTDATGHFVLNVGEGARELLVADPHWCTVVAGRAASGDREGVIEPTIVAAPALELAGHVVDQAGLPVPAARVRCLLPGDFLAMVPAPLDASHMRSFEWRAACDERGAFDLGVVGAVPAARLLATAPGYRPAELALPATTCTDLVIELEPEYIPRDAIVGRVVDVRGHGVEGAKVCLGLRGTVSGPGGEFVLSRERRVVGYDSITALHRGHLPARAPLPEPREDGAPIHVELQLGDEPLSLQGRIVDVRGQPLSGLRVWAHDAELFPGLDGHLAYVEGYLGGGLTGAELRARFTVDGELTRSPLDLLENEPSVFWGFARTDRKGQFELHGLQDRFYVLRLLRVERQQMVETEPLSAGRGGVEIVFDPEFCPAIAGIIVDRRGNPLLDVRVELNCVTVRAHLESRSEGRVGNSMVTHGRTCLTDAQGRFRFEGCGKNQVFLSLNADHIVDTNVGMFEGGLEEAGFGPLDALRITVEARTHLRLELSRPDLADHFQLLSEAGVPQPILLFEGGGMNTSLTRRVHAGRTRVYAVSDQARTLVLYDGEREVGRAVLQLVGGEVNVVRY